MASQSSREALSIPLILGCIFQNLAAGHRYKTLVKCMSVSRLWEKEARLVLFNQVGYSESDGEFAVRKNFMLGPDLFAVLYMPTSLKRKQIYARSIRSIKIDATPEPEVLALISQDHRELLGSLDFSLVRELQIYDPRVWQLYSDYCPTYMCENLSKLVIHDLIIPPDVLLLLSVQCPRLRHLETGPEVPEEIASLITNLDLLETLIVGSISDGEDEYGLFKAVAQHGRLQSVSGLPIQRSWIWRVSRIQSAPWFKSIRHIGAIRVFPDADSEDDPHMYEYAYSLQLLVEKTPNLVSLQIQAYTKMVLEILVTLDQIQELEIVPRYLDDSGNLTIAALLEDLLPMKNLRVLRLPKFHRCRKHNIAPRKATANVSWRVVEAFTRRMPNLQEMSFCAMHLNGMTPGYAPSSLDFSPAIWKRNLGWEILDWDLASTEFKDAMSDIGRFMPHNYFGPYHDGVESLLEYIDNGRGGSGTDDDEVWSQSV